MLLLEEREVAWENLHHGGTVSREPQGSRSHTRGLLGKACQIARRYDTASGQLMLSGCCCAKLVRSKPAIGNSAVLEAPPTPDVIHKCSTLHLMGYIALPVLPSAWGEKITSYVAFIH